MANGGLVEEPPYVPPPVLNVIRICLTSLEHPDLVKRRVQLKAALEAKQYNKMVRDVNTVGAHHEL